MYARVGELRRQEMLVGVLRVVEHERIARQTGADVVERDAGDSAPASPQIGGPRHDAGRDDIVGKTELAIELQRARVHAKGARVRRDVVVAVDDANADAESRQHERKHQPRRPRADDEDLGRTGWVGHRAIQFTKSAWASAFSYSAGRVYRTVIRRAARPPGPPASPSTPATAMPATLRQQAVPILSRTSPDPSPRRHTVGSP